MMLTIFIVNSIVIGSYANVFPLTGDEIRQKSFEAKLPSGLAFPFMDTLYDKLYILKDGIIGFDSNVAFSEKYYFSGLSRKDPAFIAPYHYHGYDTPGIARPGCSGPGKILYRSGTGQSASQILADELTEHNKNVQQSFVGMKQFAAKWDLMVSWENVYRDVSYSFDCQTYTFQLLLLTDGNTSFAMFNYPSVSVDESHLSSHFIQTGFNAGDGRGFTPTKINLSKRFFYKVDKRDIVEGGCTDEGKGTISIYPEIVSMFGGQMVEVFGPCYPPGIQVIKCRFGKNDHFVTYGFQVDAVRVRCSVPFLTFKGWTTIELALGFNQYMYSTNIFVALEDTANKRLGLPYLGKHSGWNETDTKTLTITWDSTKLTYDINARVKIELIGYRETDTEIQQATLLEIGERQATDNTLTFDTDKKMCVSTFCTDYEIGFVKVELKNQALATSHRYQIAEVLLGYYVNVAMISQFGKDWPKMKCKQWYNNDKINVAWVNGLLPCPCTLTQAFGDIGRWKADDGCDIDSGSSCTYHKGAVHCVRTIEPTIDGAGNQCCYDKDGNLMFNGDSYQGSSSDRSNPLGMFPYQRPKSVPSVSHWIQDLSPYYYCCLWSSYEYCDMYTKLRPTVDCTRYTPPTPGIIFGQGHVRTFDDSSHRICAEGDYILMTIQAPELEQVIVQGRFSDNVVPIDGMLNNSVTLTNLAVEVGVLDTVEIRLRPPLLGRQKSHLEVVVNDKYFYFNTRSTRWQDFEKFSVMNTNSVNPEEHGNFTIILKNGIGIQVAVKEHIMTALFMIPEILKGYVDGLLGNFNMNPDDDLGGVLNGASILETYHMFQYKWAVNNSVDSVMQVNIKPEINAVSCSADVKIIDTMFCGSNEACNFDFASTRNQDAAKSTLYMSERMNEIRSFMKPVQSCGFLDIQDARKSSRNTNLGSTVTITGCYTDREPAEPTTFTCILSGGNSSSWNPKPTPVCSETESVVNSDVIIGLVIGLVAVIVIVILAIIFVKKFMMTKRKHDKYMIASKGEKTADAEL
ncbi:sushi domain-containing protein 2-like isoform X4 [Mytilus californianus]|uniref:sushi domain-containing protein 2-like isoform X4 n=1 Tax=Mytilus californianus TaxID=6549 RepID=UPI002245D104|nr:sushi domain-containing protein 2-like isoform X4 [Mytilus californianus]